LRNAVCHQRLLFSSRVAPRGMNQLSPALAAFAILQSVCRRIASGVTRYSSQSRSSRSARRNLCIRQLPIFRAGMSANARGKFFRGFLPSANAIRNDGSYRGSRAAAAPRINVDGAFRLSRPHHERLSAKAAKSIARPGFTSRSAHRIIGYHGGITYGAIFCGIRVSAQAQKNRHVILRSFGN